jgi:hypothetical protein
MDLSISCCRVIFGVVFFFAGWSFWVVAGAVAAGVVVAGADVVAAGAEVVAAGAGADAAGAGVDVSGAGAVVAAGAGAVVISDPELGAFWAIRRPAGTHTATDAAATIRESLCI